MKLLLLVITVAVYTMFIGNRNDKSSEQSSKLMLDYITTFRIKVEDGYMKFTFDTTGLLNDGKYIFVYAGNGNEGFFHLEGQDPLNFVYVKRTKHTTLSAKKTFKDFFSGHGYKVQLTYNFIGQYQTDFYSYQGNLRIEHNADTLSVKVHGITDFPMQ